MTLIEIIVALLVLVILAGFAIFGYRAVVDRSNDSKQLNRQAQILKEAQALYVQRTNTDSTYTWNQAVADAVDDLPQYKSGAWAEGVEAAPINQGTNGWTVTVDSGVAVFSSGPNDIIVKTVGDVVYVASAMSDADQTRAVYGYIRRTGAPRVWIARCGGSTCDANTGTGGEPASGSYPIGTRTPTAPNVPGSVSIALVGGSYNSVRATFSEPADDGGASVDSYRVVCTSSDGGQTRTATGSTSPLTVTSLDGGKTYTCTVAAHNNVGWGTESAASDPINAKTTPGAPSITSISSGVGSLNVAFTAPAENGGSAITAYKYQLDGGSWVQFSGTTSPQSIGSLTAGVTYNVCIRASNIAGDGAVSACQNGSAYTTPGVPTVSTGNGGDGALIVYFGAPTSDGGSPITSYQYSLDSGAWTTFSNMTSPKWLTGLSIGAHTVKVRAVNAAGAGTESGAVSGTADGAPGAVNSTSGAALGPYSARLSWSYTSPPADHAGYRIYNDSWGLVANNIATTTTSYDVGGLSQNSSYGWYIVAYDNAGNNSSGNYVSATTTNAPPPAPANLGISNWGHAYIAPGVYGRVGYDHYVCFGADGEVASYQLWKQEWNWVLGWWPSQVGTLNGPFATGSTQCMGGSSTLTFPESSTGNSVWVVAVDAYGATTNSVTKTVNEGWYQQYITYQSEQVLESPTTTMTINGCSDSRTMYRDPWYERGRWASWTASIARGGSPWYDLTSSTRKLDRHTPTGGWANWGPVGTQPVTFSNSYTPPWSSASGTWGFRAGSSSPCYWNTTYPTTVSLTVDFHYMATLVGQNEGAVGPSYG